MDKKITMQTNPDKIVEIFKNCTETDSVNLKTDKGFIYEVGGILNKLEDNNHSMFINNNWVIV